MATRKATKATKTTKTAIAGGLVHEVPDDLRAALVARPATLARWEALSPIGRNEFLCWVEDAKQPATRARRITRTCEELGEGMKRPCCWVGCIHRTDKAPGRWQQAVLVDKQPATKPRGKTRAK